MKKLLLTIVTIMLILPAWSQREGRPAYDQEKFESARIAFISQRLNLTPDQATKFWPLYNQHNAQREANMKKLAGISRTNASDLSDAKAKDLIQERFSVQAAILKQEEEFTNKIMEVITPQQALRLSNLNREFAREVYRMQRGGRGGGDRVPRSGGS